jgi:hypothetical protein
MIYARVQVGRTLVRLGKALAFEFGHTGGLE